MSGSLAATNELPGGVVGRRLRESPMLLEYRKIQMYGRTCL